MRKRPRRSHRKAEVKVEGPTHWFSVLNERHISSEATDSREDLAAFNALHGIRRIRHPYSRVDVSRNRIVRKFLEITTHPESSVTMLDTDHIHRPEVVKKLIEDNLPIVGALAFRRSEPYDPQVYIYNEAGELQQPVEWKPGVMVADIVGAAALCIRRKVFTELEAKGFHYPWFRMMYEDGQNTFLGEDWYFGEICRKAGIRHHCDMTLISPHQDTLWIDEKPWLMRQGKLIPDLEAKTRPEPWFQEQIFGDTEQKWQALKDRHKGETALIIGNGPSLKDIPLEFLNKYPSFGTNRIYRLSGFTPDYYAAVNPLVLDQFGREMIQAYRGKVKRFFLSSTYLRNNPQIAEQPAVLPLQSLGDLRFFTDPRQGLYEGHTISFVCLQLAYWMGFSTVLLIGVDHRYVYDGAPNQELIAEGDDPNHFDKLYFSSGNRWHAPDLMRSEQAYRMAREAFEADGRRIFNITPDSALTIFEKGNWQEWTL